VLRNEGGRFYAIINFKTVFGWVVLWA
jgi:hypothetical protein